MQEKLTRRERQIMDIVYRRGQATVAEVQSELDDPPGYSGVRAQLRVLVEKGFLKHVYDGPRYVFSATVARETVRRSALRQLVRNFFDGSPSQAVAALLELPRTRLGREELERIEKMIERAKREGR